MRNQGRVLREVLVSEEKIRFSKSTVKNNNLLTIYIIHGESRIIHPQVYSPPVFHHPIIQIHPRIFHPRIIFSPPKNIFIKSEQKKIRPLTPRFCGRRRSPRPPAMVFHIIFFFIRKWQKLQFLSILFQIKSLDSINIYLILLSSYASLPNKIFYWYTVCIIPFWS